MPAQQINPLPGSVQQQGGQVQQLLYGGASVARVRPLTGADFFIRKTGSDTNGGSSASITPDAQGTDGVTNGTTTFTAASGTFTQADVNKLVMITTKARYRIVAVGSTTSVTLSGSPSAGSSLTWKVGGAVLTIAALLASANSPTGTILGGDRIYIGAGTYREAALTTSPTPTFELLINGDVTGERTGDPGMVEWSAWTTDNRLVNAASIITLASKSFYTFQNISFVGSTTATIVTSGTTGELTFNDCAFANAGNSIGITVAYQRSANIRINRCRFLTFSTTSSAVSVTLTTGIGSHYTSDVIITGSLFVGPAGGGGVLITNSGTLAGRGGGVRVAGCSFIGVGTGVSANSTSVSTSFQSVVTGCLFAGCSVGVNASTSGQIIEQQNYFGATTPRTNVSTGRGSVPGANSAPNTSWAPLLHYGQEEIWGGMPRWMGEPGVNSPFLGFGVDQGGGDLVGRPRPAGQYSSAAASSAVGALQRGNTAVTDAAPIGAGTTPIQITGPGFEDFYVPVPARAITVSCSVRFTGTPARLEVLANPTIGVLGQSVVASGLPNVVQTITLAAFTPTAAGSMVTVRIYNPDPSGTSVLEVDDFLVTG